MKERTEASGHPPAPGLLQHSIPNSMLNVLLKFQLKSRAAHLRNLITLVGSIFIASTLLVACSQENDTVDSQIVIEEVVPETNSFNMRNREIREEMLAEFTANNIEYWINDDGSIGYNTVDGEAIDRIGNLIRAEYIHRN